MEYLFESHDLAASELANQLISSTLADFESLENLPPKKVRIRTTSKQSVRATALNLVGIHRHMKLDIQDGY